MRPQTDPSRQHAPSAPPPPPTCTRQAPGGQPERQAGPHTPAAQTGPRRAARPCPTASTAQPSSRALTVAAATTVALVLAENSPLPETDQDVRDLTTRLRGHIEQLGTVVPAGEPSLLAAQQLGAAPAPDTYMGSRVHLRRLAEAVQALVATAERHADTAPATASTSSGSTRRSIDVMRVLVFAVALIVLAIATCIPQS